jgi:hypothetical protein
VPSDEPAWPAIVDAKLRQRVNARITITRGPERRRPRATPGTYLLAGLVRCKVCGRSMHGATLKGNPYYRCNRARPDYADTGRPRTTAIREDRIVSVLDDWLGQLTGADHRETTIAADLAADTAHNPEPPEVQAARRALRELPVELDRVLAAIRAGMDPDVAVLTTKQIQRDLAGAEATITSWEHQHDAPAPLTADQISEALDHAGHLAAMLSEAERETRARLSDPGVVPSLAHQWSHHTGGTNLKVVPSHWRATSILGA